MGLLDDLLGQLTNAEPRTQPGLDRPTARASAGGGMSPLLTALLPVVLSMLAGGRTRGAAAGAGMRADAPAGGGLGDILGSVHGGGGAGGGLGALLEQFQRAGFGEQAGSWVGTGANQPLPADAMSQVFGRDGIAAIARRAGVSDDDASRGLAELLPEVVDRVTPSGDVPPGDSLNASVDALTRRLGLA
jgi:uncharacterized protein YidB (DUF937 family)